MNDRYLGRNYATDVLSFFYGGITMDGLPFLGEILIAPDVAVEQAKRYGTSNEREIRKLLVHGILHLVGYDHEVDEGQMNRTQRNLLRRKSIRNSPPLLIPRARR